MNTKFNIKYQDNKSDQNKFIFYLALAEQESREIMRRTKIALDSRLKEANNIKSQVAPAAQNN